MAPGPEKSTSSTAPALTLRLNPSKDNDLYTSAFRNMHERDLYIMRHPGEGVFLTHFDTMGRSCDLWKVLVTTRTRAHTL